jgi:hypothetical protein
MHQSKPTDKPSNDGTRERVSGPFKGYHVVALGCHIGGEGSAYRGFYKIYRSTPGSYYSEQPLAQGRCGPESSSGIGALRMAETAAAFQIQGMPADSTVSAATSAGPTTQRRIP